MTHDVKAAVSSLHTTTARLSHLQQNTGTPGKKQIKKKPSQVEIPSWNVGKVFFSSSTSDIKSPWLLTASTVNRVALIYIEMTYTIYPPVFLLAGSQYIDIFAR